MAVNPSARDTELIVQEVDDELAIYDQRTDRAHSLHAEIAAVWRLCDGDHTVEQIGSELSRPIAAVHHALDELRRCDLLADPGISRRDGLHRLAKAGTGALTAPLIYSVVVRPAFAATSTAMVCSSNCAGGRGNCLRDGHRSVHCAGGRLRVGQRRMLIRLGWLLLPGQDDQDLQLLSWNLRRIRGCLR